jgi:hypothetical protein
MISFDGLLPPINAPTLELTNDVKGGACLNIEITKEVALKGIRKGIVGYGYLSQISLVF